MFILNILCEMYNNLKRKSLVCYLLIKAVFKSNIISCYGVVQEYFCISISFSILYLLIIMRAIFINLKEKINIQTAEYPPPNKIKIKKIKRPTCHNTQMGISCLPKHSDTQTGFT